MAKNSKKSSTEMEILHQYILNIDSDIEKNKKLIQKYINKSTYCKSNIFKYRTQRDLIPKKGVEELTNLYILLDDIYLKRELLIKIKHGYYQSLNITKQTYINWKKLG